MEQTIRSLDGAAAAGRLPALAALLADAVAHGASVNFMAGFTEADGRRFWQGQLPGIAAGERVLLVAEEGAALLGCVVLSLAPQPNGAHRAEVGKMLVHSAARRRGIGRRLLLAVEAEALRRGRTLLMLDTEAGSAGDLLYRACGWTAAGTVPDHAWTPDGRLAPTALFFKALGPHRAPPGASSPAPPSPAPGGSRSPG